MRDLIRRGFFTSARTVTHVVLYVNRSGFNFTRRELAPVLLRLLQDGALRRTRGADGRVVYYQR
ncbi:MAG: hypothetical protein ACLFTT_14265 [Candidatus Hydrogenedentota bacterium]